MLSAGCGSAVDMDVDVDVDVVADDDVNCVAAVVRPNETLLEVDGATDDSSDVLPSARERLSTSSSVSTELGVVGIVICSLV